MPGLFPDVSVGGVVVRDIDGNCLAPAEVQNAYCPPVAFTTSCEITALPSNCNARITPQQLNAIQSELLGLAEAFNLTGNWNCGSVNNLAALFHEWEAVLATRLDDADTVSDTKLEWSSVPASAGADGIAGQIAYDSGFFYICVAANTWRRVAIATW